MLTFSSCKNTTRNQDKTESTQTSELIPAPVTDTLPQDTTSELFSSETTLPPETTVYVPGMELVKNGSALSETGTKLILRLDYNIYKEAGAENYIVEASLYLDCYSIFTGPRNNGTLNVNGNTVTYSTPELSIDKNTENRILLTESEFILENLTSGEIVLSASWLFNGVYAGVKIDWLNVEAVVDLK